MSNNESSPAWYKIAGLKPYIRSHSRIQRQIYRDELWYVLQDQSTGQSYRFSPAAYSFIGLMDGKRTVQELWDLVAQKYHNMTPSREEVVFLLGRLHAAGVLLTDAMPNMKDLLSRVKKAKKSRLKIFLRSSPLFVRIPLADPDKFLADTVQFVRFFYSIPALFILIGLVAAASLQTWMHWDALTSNLIDRVLVKENFLILWFVYPIVKAMHELSHGYAVKKWGGEVHEIGIMLLVFMPIPYIDATAASSFRSKWQRITVGASGIAVELFLASLSVFLWLSLEQGLARAVVYNVIVIAGVSTVLFNGNPLLRFDGYYILSDLLDIPNLAQRSLQYLGYLVNRYIFGIKKAIPPYYVKGERFWFITFGIASFIYKICVYSAIILFVSSKFFIIGVLLGIWATFSIIVLPVLRKMHALLTDSFYREKRTGTMSIAASLLASALILLFFLPLPYLTKTEGVIWPPEESFIRSGANGIIKRIVAQPDSLVKKGDVLIECEDPILAANINILKSRLKEFELRYNAAHAEDQIQAKIIEEEITALRKRLSRDEERQSEMRITSPADGTFILPEAVDLPDRFVRQGDLLGYVLQRGATTVRFVVPQHNVDLVTQQTKSIELRFSSDMVKIYPGSIIRAVPGAVDQLPSSVLGTTGGGDITVDPLDASGRKTFENLFQFDVSIDDPPETLYVGSRVYARFNHGFQPLAYRAYRSIRQLFLRRFHV